MDRKDFTFERVMIIDDTQIDRYLASYAMKKNHFTKEIIECDMATKALEYLEANKNDPEKIPQVILLDIRMPEMDGFEFLERISSLPQFTDNSCYIIMLSSSLSRADHERADSNPIVKKFINKPLKNENLEQIKELFLTTRA